MIWYAHFLSNFLQFVVIHTAKSFSIVSEPEVDVFLDKIEKRISEFEAISIEIKKQREKILGAKAIQNRISMNCEQLKKI